MFKFTKYDGTPITREPKGLMVRLSDVYRQAGDKMADFMAQAKQLTDADRADFTLWFNQAGYPITKLPSIAAA